MLSWDAYRGAGSLGKCSWVKGLVLRQPGSQRENFKKEGTSSVCSAALGEWCWQLHVVRPGWHARQWQGCWPWACTTRVPDRWQGSVLAAIRESWGGHSAGGLAKASEGRSRDTSGCICWMSEEHTECQSLREEALMSGPALGGRKVPSDLGQAGHHHPSRGARSCWGWGSCGSPGFGSGVC